MTVDEQVALKANVLRLRQRKGWTQRELAKVADIHEDVIGKINRLENISDTSVGRLAFALGVDVEQLFYYDSGSHEKAATSEEKQARKSHALREIERIGDALGDLAEQERYWDVILATSRAFGDASSRGAKAKRGDGGVKGSAVRGGGSDFGESAANVAGETNTGL